MARRVQGWAAGSRLLFGNCVFGTGTSPSRRAECWPVSPQGFCSFKTITEHSLRTPKRASLLEEGSDILWETELGSQIQGWIKALPQDTLPLKAPEGSSSREKVELRAQPGRVPSGRQTKASGAGGMCVCFFVQKLSHTKYLLRVSCDRGRGEWKDACG